MSVDERPKQQVPEVKRLRWWHRGGVWVGHAGWAYVWSRGCWVGHHRNHPDDPIALTRHHDTASYGPYRRVPVYCYPPDVSGPLRRSLSRFINKAG